MQSVFGMYHWPCFESVKSHCNADKSIKCKDIKKKVLEGIQSFTDVVGLWNAISF